MTADGKPIAECDCYLRVRLLFPIVRLLVRVRLSECDCYCRLRLLSPSATAIKRVRLSKHKFKKCCGDKNSVVRTP